MANKKKREEETNIHDLECVDANGDVAGTIIPRSHEKLSRLADALKQSACVPIRNLKGEITHYTIRLSKLVVDEALAEAEVKS